MKTKITAIVLLACVTTSAADFVLKTTQLAKLRYSVQKKRADKQYLDTMKRLNAQYSKDLEAAKSVAMKAEKLDEAVNIQKEIERVKLPPKPPEPPKIPKARNSRFANTKWKPLNNSLERAILFRKNYTWTMKFRDSRSNDLGKDLNTGKYFIVGDALVLTTDDSKTVGTGHVAEDKVLWLYWTTGKSSLPWAVMR